MMGSVRVETPQCAATKTNPRTMATVGDRQCSSLSIARWRYRINSRYYEIHVCTEHDGILRHIFENNPLGAGSTLERTSLI